MKTAAEFRAEAARMREVAMTVTDSEVLFEIHAMIDELERLARALGNGDATPLHTYPMPPPPTHPEMASRSHGR
jgi:hypothetical protein